MAMTTAQKLRIKPGDTVRLIGTPDEYMELLGELPAGVNFTTVSGDAVQAIHWLVNTVTELSDGFTDLLPDLQQAERVWIAYPRKNKYAEGDANRDSIWRYLESQGWKAVANYPVGPDLSVVWAKPGVATS